MIVVDKISYSIDSVKPRAVWVLVLQDEIQIAFCDFPMVFLRKNLGGARQQESTISCSVNNSALIERSVGTTTGLFRCSKILNINSGVSRNRFEDQFPLVSWVQFENLEEGFVRVRRCSNERCLFLDNSVTSDPVKWISPAIFLKI